MALTPFIISCDVSKAFDSVDAQHLKQLIGTLFKAPNYQIISQALVVPTILGLRSFYNRKGLPADRTSLRKIRSSAWNGALSSCSAITVRLVGSVLILTCSSVLILGKGTILPSVMSRL